MGGLKDADFRKIILHLGFRFGFGSRLVLSSNMYFLKVKDLSLCVELKFLIQKARMRLELIAYPCNPNYLRGGG
jgi:hypothetical protein